MEEKIKIRLSQVIKEYMLAHSLNQEQMAAHLRVHQTLVSAYLRGSYAPRLGRLIEILSLVDLSLDAFLGSIDPTDTPSPERDLELA